MKFDTLVTERLRLRDIIGGNIDVIRKSNRPHNSGVAYRRTGANIIETVAPLAAMIRDIVNVGMTRENKADADICKLLNTSLIIAEHIALTYHRIYRRRRNERVMGHGYYHLTVVPCTLGFGGYPFEAFVGEAALAVFICIVVQRKEAVAVA